MWRFFLLTFAAQSCEAFFPGNTCSQSTRKAEIFSSASTSSLLASSYDVDFLPSRVSLDEACLQYPVTLARRLFSSVPRREFAVDHVSCCFSSEVVLLQGASSSGKSALMKVILGAEEATSGKLNVETACTDGDPAALQVVAKPVMLADKPPFDNKQSARAILEEQARHDLPKELNDDSRKLDSRLAEAFAYLVQLDGSQCSKTPSELSPSENYRLRLAEACIQSSAPDSVLSEEKVVLPGPILLLDEWMDFETRDSSSKVEVALLEIADTTGAVILCATHKPNLWKKLESATELTSQMTMCRGEILALRQHK